MKTMKKVISVLMMVCIFASFMTVAAYADDAHVESAKLSASSNTSSVAAGENISITAYVGDSVSVTANVVAVEGATDTFIWNDSAYTFTSSNGGKTHTYKCDVKGDYTVSITTNGNGNGGTQLTATCTINVVDKPTSGTGTIIASADSVMVDKKITLDPQMTTGDFKMWEVVSKDGKGKANIEYLQNKHVELLGTAAGVVTVKAYDTANNVFATKDITVTAPRTLEIYCSVARIDNGETACFDVTNKQAGETFTWTYTTIPSTLEIVKKTSVSGDLFYVTGGKGNGNVTVTATSANGETGSLTVPVNSLGYGDATLSPTNVNWAKGQGNLTFTVTPVLYAAYMDDVCFTGSGNTSKYSYVYSSSNLVINSSFLATLPAGQHVLRVDTVDANGNNGGTQYAYITVSGTASAAYGDNAHVRGTTSDLYFTANSAINSVTISGTTIDPANYTLSNNGKTITLKANFLNLLNYGSYTMKLGNSNGGTETATFRVVTANYAPATGDESNLAIWIAVMVISGAGAIALIPRRKKEM